MFGAAISIIGYIVLITQKSAGASYVGAILAATGVYPCVPVTLAWAGSNAGGDMRRGVALAMVIGMGNLGGICSSFIYLKPPRFFLGHGVILGCLVGVIVLCMFAMWDFNRHNKLNIARCEAEKIDESRTDEFKKLGNDSPLFRWAQPPPFECIMLTSPPVIPSRRLSHCDTNFSRLIFLF
jgi:hypothetical protein